MQDNDIAHNVYFTRGKLLATNNHNNHKRKSVIRAYIWPRKKFMGT